MRIFIILLLVAVSLAVIKLPLTKKKISVREKFSSNFASVSPATSFDWPMEDFKGGEFFGMIEIGSQKEPMSLKLDIGFQSTWIPNSMCTKCHAKTLFNDKLSYTYIPSTQNVRIPNSQRGNINGIYATDSFGTISETIVTNQCFISANEDGNVQQFSDGGMGISWLGTADTYKCPNYISNLKSQNIIEEAIIGLYLDDEHPSMHIGGINEENIKKEDVFYFPNVANATDPNFVVRVENVGLEGGAKGTDQEIAFKGPISVAVTTSTTDIKLTRADFEQLTKDMPTKDLDCKHEYYRYICTGAENLNYKSFPSIWLNINGDNDTRYLGIQPQDYVNLNITTHLAIFNFDIRSEGDPWGEKANWVLGTSFLTNYYSLFNMNGNSSIGFGSIKESHKIYKSWSNITHHAHNDDSNTTTIMVIVLSIIGGLMVIGLIICLVIRCKKRRENQETGGEYAVI